MAEPYIDLALLGAPQLQKQLRRLELRVQKRIIRKALRRSARRIKKHVVANISGSPVGVIEGEYKAAWEATKVQSEGIRGGQIRVGIGFPTRAELGIDPKDKHYYPAAIEFGHGSVPAHPHVRPAVDQHKHDERRRIGQEIGRDIEREAMKK